MHLYHGSLLRHEAAIQTDGLVPMVGEFTKGSYGEDAQGVIPAVFMADGSGLERVVQAMVVATMAEVTDEDFDEYDVGPDYQINDDLFFKYGAIYVIDHQDHFRVAGQAIDEETEPWQAEDGDYYSLVPVIPAQVIKGDELRIFLEDHNLVPSTINCFVDPDSHKAGERPQSKITW